MKNQNPTSFYSAKAKWLAVAAVAMIAAAGQAKAQVVNFDFPPGGGGTNFFGQGALSDAGNNYWNPVVFNGTTPATNLESDGLTSTPITLALSSFSSNYNRGTQGPFIGAESDSTDSPGALFAPFAYAHQGLTYTLTLSNVAAGSYNLFLYATNSDDQNLDSTVFTVGSQSQTADNNNSPEALNSFVEGANYVELTNVSPVNGVLTITTAVGADGANGEVDFNGLQLQSAEVPEPSAYALLLAGLGSMVVLLRNKRLRS